jgi:predicted HD phosphohydrolase
VGGNPNKRDTFKGNPYFDDCSEFCEKWDQSSFDPDYETKPLEFFADMVREVFARKPYAPDVIKKGVRVKLSDPATAARRKAA